MKKKIGRILLWFTGALLLCFAIFATVLYLNREKIKQAVFTEINKILTEPVAVANVDVSLRKFPYASVVFDDVFSRGANGQEGDTLLYARQVYFEFSLWNVFSSHLSIHRISLESGTLKVLRPKDALPNYQIWRQDSTASSSVFTLEEVTFQDFSLYQYEGASHQSASGFVHKLSFSGSFDADSYVLHNTGKLYIDSLIVGNTVYLQSVSSTIAFTLAGNSGSASITEGKLTLGEIGINFNMAIDEAVTVEANSNKVELEKLQQLALSQNWGVTDKIIFSGHANIGFKAVFEESKDTWLTLDFKVNSTNISGYENARIKDFNCTGSYHLQNNRDHFKLARFNGSGRTGGFEGSLDINDLSRPGVILDLKSDLALSEWLIFLPLDTLTKPEGRARIDVHFENQFKSLKEIKPEELKRARASGNLVLKDIGFTFKNSSKRIEDLSADLRFLGNDLKVSSFSFRTGQSDIYLEGIFENVLNYAYFKDQKLKVDTRVRSRELVLEDFISSGTTKARNDYSLAFAHSLDLALDLQVDSFLFDNFFASKIRGSLLVKNGVIEARSISLNADEGTFNGNLRIDTRPARHQLSAGLSASSVNIHKLFASFNNFGQDAIAADNLFGTADLSLELSCSMSPALEIDLPSIEMKSKLVIENGRLMNYEPMLALSRFADIKELQDVRFSRLENNIGISGSKVIIPMMNINSNILDMGLQGEHGFDNVIDYSIRLKLSDVLFTKRKNNKQKSEFDEHLIVVEQEDDPNIYIKMSGPALDPSISLDREGINQSINRDLKEQGKQIKNIFRKKEKQEKKDDSGIKFDLFGDDKDK